MSRNRKLWSPRQRVHQPGRRRFLRGAGATGLITVGLPVLEIFGGRSARAACDEGFPQRLIVFTWGNGNLPLRWNPQTVGPDWELTDQLAPLADFRQKLSVVTGYSIKVDNISPHWSGAAGLLTGSQVMGDDDSWTVHGPTIDQAVAQQVGGDTIFRSLQIGVTDERVFSYSGPNAPNYGIVQPTDLYNHIFGDTFREPGGEGLVDPRLGYRRSVLDSVMQDVAELEVQLGSADKARLDQHLTGIREMEQRLARLQEDPPDLEACVRPTEPGEFPDQAGRPQIAARSAALAELTAMALACDQTRVVSFEVHRALSNVLYPDASDGHHNLTHNEPGEQEEVHAITVHVMEQLAALLGALDAIPEGSGTLLDNTIVLATSELSEGKTHSLDEIPLIIAGGGCGSLVTGQHIRSVNQDNVGKVMLTVQRAMGVNAAEWGLEGARVTDSVPELEA